MPKRIKPWKDVRTSGDVKAYAEGRGAKVERANEKHPEWDEIVTPQGRMSLTPNDRTILDKQTIGNIKRWLRLLGLMIFLLILYLFLGG